MEDNIGQTTIKSVGIKWGLIAGVAGIVFFLILMLGELFMIPGINFVGWVPFFFVLFFAMKEFVGGNAYMTFGEGVKLGLLVSVIGGVLLAVFGYVYTEFIDTELMTNMKDLIFDAWEEQGMTDEQMDQAWGFTEYFMNPAIGFVLTILKTVIVGVILSLIGSAILKKNDPDLIA